MTNVNVVENNVINMDVLREQVAELTQDKENKGEIDMITDMTTNETLLKNETTVEETVGLELEKQDELIQDEFTDVSTDEELSEDQEQKTVLFPNEELKPLRMLNKSTNSQMPKWFLNLQKRGELSFENLVQRSYVWEDSRKSYLISSMILGYPVPPIYTARSGKVYDVLDGQQRIKTIIAFLKDEFALTALAPIVCENEAGKPIVIDISGLKYSELPDVCRDAVDSYNFSIIYYNDISQEERVELFRRINNGKPLSTKERNVAYCNDVINAIELGKHPIFQEILTDKALANRNYITIVMKIWAMLNMDIKDISFESKHFNELLQNTKMSSQQMAEIKNVLDYALDVWNEIEAKSIRTKFKGETHFVSLIPAMSKAFKAGISPAMFAQFVYDFFKNPDRHYISCTRSKTGSTDSIMTRNDVLEDKYTLFFKEDKTN